MKNLIFLVDECGNGTGLRCHRHAKCDDGVCRCQHGWVGNGIDGCESEYTLEEINNAIS